MSCSNCTDYQSRAMEIRCGGKKMGDRCVYTYLYTSIYTYICTYIYTYICTGDSLRGQEDGGQVCAYIPVYTYMCRCLCSNIYILVYSACVFLYPLFSDKGKTIQTPFNPLKTSSTIPTHQTHIKHLTHPNTP